MRLAPNLMLSPCSLIDSFACSTITLYINNNSTVADFVKILSFSISNAITDDMHTDETSATKQR